MIYKWRWLDRFMAKWFKKRYLIKAYKSNKAGMFYYQKVGHGGEFSGSKIFNLTQIFGRGNEPTPKQMDKYLNDVQMGGYCDNGIEPEETSGSCVKIITLDTDTKEIKEIFFKDKKVRYKNERV